MKTANKTAALTCFFVVVDHETAGRFVALRFDAASLALSLETHDAMGRMYTVVEARSAADVPKGACLSGLEFAKLCHAGFDAVTLAGRAAIV